MAYFEIMEKPGLKYVVGLGASAGGLEALQQFFGSLSENLNMAFVVVQHLSPDFDSLMNELLKKYTSFEIITPSEKTLLKPKHIYLIPKSKNLIYKDHHIVPIEKDASVKINLPIDIFFESLGEGLGEKSIGIVLSGTGTDGSRGIKSIKENGGLVMIQTPESSKFDGMPRSSLKLGISDLVESPEGIAKVLGKLESHSLKNISLAIENTSEQNQPFMNEVLGHLKSIYSIDFTLYRSETLIRRTHNRMQISNCNNLQEYYYKMKSDPKEANLLYNDFLIGVTKFFRDSKAWKKIESKVIPDLIKSASPSGSIRVWSVGCSTGEEAYSVAMLLDDQIKKSEKSITYKIFATDPSKNAIDFASKGVYNDNIAVDVDSGFLFEYFTKKDYAYQIKKKIREKIIFSQHDALSDPPIIGVDLIICRNMLIYIKPEWQKMILNNFQFSLNFNGYLFLGISENVSTLEKVFGTIESNYKIYQNILKRKLIPQSKVSRSFNTNDKGSSAKVIPNSFDVDISNERIFQKLILNDNKKANIFVTEEFDILYSLGKIEQFLSLPEGIMKRYNLLEMMGKKESLLFRNALRTCFKDNKKIIFNEIPLTKKEGGLLVDASFTPKWLEDFNKKVILIELSINNNDTEKNVLQFDSSNFETEQVKLLETEIQELKFELQKSKEELEAANEELQASNEELLGANEELQSSNEELQSVNEELYAVNNEFQVKIQELSQLNDDINNLSANT